MLLVYDWGRSPDVEECVGAGGLVPENMTYRAPISGFRRQSGIRAFLLRDVLVKMAPEDL